MRTDPADRCLRVFHPAIAAWFSARYGKPTDVQRLAWERIAAGEHVLATAPTGSGKTLAAFLWALDRLLTGAWPGGRVRVLYVSPLRALNTDIQRNLLVPLAELRDVLTVAGAQWVNVTALTRSGDTPAEERQRMARRPPEILITTPESFNILLTSSGGRAMLAGVRQLILDEVHAVISSKRGVHLVTAVERLAALAGEVQRVALSATVQPLDRAARWVGGAFPGREGAGGERPVAIVTAASEKKVDLAVRFPARMAVGGAAEASESFWETVVAELTEALGRHRSTLIFANSRRLVERLTRLINEDGRSDRTSSHHGSLSRELRTLVEERLRRGELTGLIATSSLELGIDIGTLEQTILVETPPSIASAVQRIGRAGHAVGEISRARLIPLVARDLLDAAVMAQAVRDNAIEPVRPVMGALDVLAQVIISAVATETWEVERLLSVLRASDPYRHLPRRHFELVLDMLAGRYASTRVRQLRPMLAVDRVAGTIRGLPGATQLVYGGGGTIPDRGYFHLRVADTDASLGELDEEFVWERQVGDTFTLGVQTWRIERITHNDVYVRPARARAAMAPFWRAEERSRSPELSQRIADFLESVEERLDDPVLHRELVEWHCLDATAASALVSFLTRQRAAMSGVLPHRHRLVAELARDPAQGSETPQLILHTLWGGRVNRPFALALQAAWHRTHRLPLEVMHDDDCVAATLPGDADVNQLLASVTSTNVAELVNLRLAESGFFGARFREAAGTALLLPREGFRRRTPLWLSRQRAKELLEAVARWDDFPIVLEAWRTCLQDELDVSTLQRRLEELEVKETRLAVVRTDAPSPFAAQVAWKRTNRLMYEDDTPPGGAARLRGDLVREVARAPHLRPRLSPELVAVVTAKLQRTHPGYAPPPEEFASWVEERVVLSPAAWDELLSAVARDHGADPAVVCDGLRDRVAAVALPGDRGPRLVAAVDTLPALARALELPLSELVLFSPAGDGASADAASVRLAALPEAVPAVEVDPGVELVAEAMRFFGPVALSRLARDLPLPDAVLQRGLTELTASGRVLVDEFTAGAAEPEACDAENLERLLRLARAAARPVFAALPADALPLFLAGWQFDRRGDGVDALRQVLERLFGAVAPAAAWEKEILPARLEHYSPAWLDALLVETELVWVGLGQRRLAFIFEGDRDLIATGRPPGAEASNVVPTGPGRYTLDDLSTASGLPTAELTRRLWEAAWRGEVTSDSLAPIRQALEAGFTATPIESRQPWGRPAPRARRGAFERWRASRPFTGVWRRLVPVDPPADALAQDELDRDRARLVLERYGVVFRELLEHEAEPLRWPRVFRSLRLLELAGEAVAGQFFRDIRGLQFASHEAVRRLLDGGGEDRIWWLNATDPASPCGLGIAGLPPGLPRRAGTSHLVLHGRRVVVVSERSAARLDIRVAPDHPRLPDYLTFLRVFLTRAASPLRAVMIAEINGEGAAVSAYRGVFEALFHAVRDGSSLRLSRRY